MGRMKLAGLLMLVAGGVVWAGEPSAGQFFGISVVSAGFSVGLAAAFCGVSMGWCISSALQGMARQPEIASKLQLNMMIGLAFIESLVLYTLFIAIIVLFANPFSKLVTGIAEGH